MGKERDRGDDEVSIGLHVIDNGGADALDIPCGIDRRSADSLPLATFVSQVRGRRPVLIEGFAGVEQARKSFALAALLRTAGNATVQVGDAAEIVRALTLLRNSRRSRSSSCWTLSIWLRLWVCRQRWTQMPQLMLLSSKAIESSAIRGPTWRLNARRDSKRQSWTVSLASQRPRHRLVCARLRETWRPTSWMWWARHAPRLETDALHERSRTLLGRV